MSDLEKAIIIAAKAHRGQKDKAGIPYILHPLRVMLSVETEEEKIVAVLHDDCEDCEDWTFERLREEGFSEKVINSLRSVSKKDDHSETYFEFIERACRDPIGRKVKRADLVDNLDTKRISKPTPEDKKRFQKYKKALSIIDNFKVDKKSKTKTTKQDIFKSIGVDGCKGGWFCVKEVDGKIEGNIYPNFSELMKSVSNNKNVFIDIPIGLPDKNILERECDKIARKMLGRRHVTVFSPPGRAALKEKDFENASIANRKELNRGLTIQSWGICQKIKEVDEYIRKLSSAGKRIFEVHPEICFLKMNKNKPVIEPKSRNVGIKKRLSLLRRIEPRIDDFFDKMLKEHKRKILAKDDILDAFAAFLTGSENGNLPRSIPDHERKDSHGIPMRISYREFS